MRKTLWWVKPEWTHLRGSPNDHDGSIRSNKETGLFPRQATGEQIFRETMAAIDVRHAMLAKLKFERDVFMAGEIAHPLGRPPRVVAFGKAANRMAAVLHEIMGGKIEAGVSVAPAETQQKLAELPIFRRRPSLSQRRERGGCAGLT